MAKIFNLIVFISVVCLCSFTYADPIRAHFYLEQTSIEPGKSFCTALAFEVEEGWHAYWKNPGATGFAPEIEWNLPEGFEILSVDWPKPERFETSEGVSYGYDDPFVILVEILPPSAISQEEIVIRAKLQWLACSDSDCLPGGEEKSLVVKVDKSASGEAPDAEKTFSAAREKMPKKNDTSKATVSAGKVNLEMGPLPVPFEKAYFYPVEVGMVDDSVPLAVTKKKEGVSFSIPLVAEKSADSLKGVLVLQNKQGEHIAALDVEASMDKPFASADFSGGVGIAILFAFIGGLILNFMPCVLPVITLKIFSFVKMAGEKRWKIMQHGLFFTLGVLVSFWALAGSLLVFRSYGESAGWGFQLQEPLFVGFLALFIFVFALSLFGLFEVGTMFSSWAGQKENEAKKSGGLSSAFFSGVLATAVATPCTGPFLGPAVGFAMTLPAILTLTIFSSMALGMSAPYLIVSIFPKTIRFLPKPGKWMVTFKEFLGFCMLATTLWLAWVFGAQTGMMGVFVLLFAFLLFGMGGWIYGKWGTPMQPKWVRVLAYAFAVAFGAIGGYQIYVAAETPPPAYEELVAMNDRPDVQRGWEPFNEARLTELKKSGKPIFIDFTAKWCLTCQTNHVVLNSDKVSQKFQELGVVRILADWTRRDDAISRELLKYGRNSVPVYVYYDGNPDHEPVVLPQILTPEIVLSYLEGKTP